MVSNQGLADRAVLCLAEGNERDAHLYSDELYARCLTYPEEARELLIKAGLKDALVSCMVCYTFGRAKEITRLRRRLLTLTDVPSADALMIAAFMARAKEVRSDANYVAVQRLYKVLCRYVDPCRATDIFRQAGLPITETKRIVMMRSSNKRAQPLILQPRAAFLVKN